MKCKDRILIVIPIANGLSPYDGDVRSHLTGEAHMTADLSAVATSNRGGGGRQEANNLPRNGALPQTPVILILAAYLPLSLAPQPPRWGA